jgi:type II secretory pathway component GspD/PulD (secretin)
VEGRVSESADYKHLPWLVESVWLRRLLWIVVGLIFGVALTLFALIWLAPQAVPLNAPAANPADITISMNDANLAAVISDSLTQAGLPFAVSNVRAHIQPNDIVTITANADVPLLPTRQLSATAHVTVINGNLSLHIEKGTIGGLALPSPLVGTLENALNQKFVTLGGLLILGHAKYDVSGVTTADNSLVLSVGRR